MGISIFKAFRSTVSLINERVLKPSDRWLTDAQTGAIIGVESPVANGPDARFVPVDITAAQANSPTSAMLADLDAVFRLNVAPYTRYTSTGSDLIASGGGNETDVLVPAGYTRLFYAPLTVYTPGALTVQGGIYVQDYA